ncbi:MAG: DUF4870 domain-containing protein [Planctomycetaceae bacterium]|nr:DUF4870 domain-containing protein [Planctomycetaceae bacterium]
MTQTPPETPVTPPPSGDKDARTWAIVSHLAALIAFLGIPLGNVIGPLVVWLIKRDIPLVDENGKEALNFQITVAIAYVAGVILTVTGIGACIGVPILIAAGLVDLIFIIIAAVKVSGGESYKYPFSLRLVK